MRWSGPGFCWPAANKPKFQNPSPSPSPARLLRTPKFPLFLVLAASLLTAPPANTTPPTPNTHPFFGHRVQSPSRRSPAARLCIAQTSYLGSAGRAELISTHKRPASRHAGRYFGDLGCRPRRRVQRPATEGIPEVHLHQLQLDPQVHSDPGARTLPHSTPNQPTNHSARLCSAPAFCSPGTGTSRSGASTEHSLSETAGPRNTTNSTPHHSTSTSTSTSAPTDGAGSTLAVLPSCWRRFVCFTFPFFSFFFLLRSVP